MCILRILIGFLKLRRFEVQVFSFKNGESSVSLSKVFFFFFKKKKKDRKSFEGQF
jgi:hypothetical protein